MKKLFLLILAAALLLSLAACGGKKAETPATDGSSPAATAALSEADVKTLTQQGFETVTKDGQTAMTTEEMVAALFDVDAVTDSSGAPLAGEYPDAEDETAPLGETVQFSDDPWEEKAVETADWKSEMSPEDLAAFEEMNNTDWDALKAETEASMAEFEDMDEGDFGDGDFEIPDVDPVEIPEGYEQYLPEGFDPNDPLAGLDMGSLMG